MKRLTKVEIINETVHYYSEDVNRRGRNNIGDCVYLSSDGSMCAVGRCLENPDEFLNASYGIDDLVNTTKEESIDELLKEEYKGHSELFWINLQELHDNNYFWNSDGLSKNGEDRVLQLLEKYAD